MPHTFPVTIIGSYKHTWGQTTYNIVPSQSMIYNTYRTYNSVLQEQKGEKTQHTNRFKE